MYLYLYLHIRAVGLSALSSEPQPPSSPQCQTKGRHVPIPTDLINLCTHGRSPMHRGLSGIGQRATGNGHRGLGNGFGMASLVGLQPKGGHHFSVPLRFLKTRLILKLMSGILMADGSDKPHDFDRSRDPESPRPCRSDHSLSKSRVYWHFTYDTVTGPKNIYIYRRCPGCQFQNAEPKRKRKPKWLHSIGPALYIGPVRSAGIEGEPNWANRLTNVIN